jgi:L-lactate dehydrogenase complex protein LldG
MSSSRTAIFAKIKAGLAEDTRSDAERRGVVEARIAAPPAHDLPARVRKSHEDLRAQFRSYLEGQSATVLEVASAADIPEAIAGYLRANNLPSRVRVGADPYLAALPWSKVPALERNSGRAAPTDETGVSHASAGIAETGTLMITSGADNPVTINFLPETHVVVVEDKDLVGPYEAALAKVRATFGKGQMPRTVNLISGPSRTGDIGGKLVMGAHGPRHMCVVIVRG